MSFIPPNPAVRWSTVVTAASYNASSSEDGIPVDSTSNAVTVVLPASPKEERKVVADVGGAAFMNTITVDGNGHTIAGASTMVVPGAYGSLVLSFNKAKGVWVVL